MDHERTIIAEGRLSSLLILACLPGTFALFMTIMLINGWGDSMYERAFGPVVYIFFYGGLLYATYEFADTLLRRREYVSATGDRLQILHHSPIKISKISAIHVHRGLLVSNIVIATGDGDTRIRAYMLKDSPDIVLERLRALMA